jgi:very-short-patch-repair endonuclease
MSLPEVLIWQGIRRRGQGWPAFRRQHPIGPYILDFYCAQARLAIEIDGASHGFGDRPQRDHRRDLYLRERGIRVCRIAAAEVLEDPSGIIDGIVGMVRPAPSTTSWSPSPGLASEGGTKLANSSISRER